MLMLGAKVHLLGAALVALWSLVLTTIGPRLPHSEALQEIPVPTHLDYGPTHGERFEPLNDAFIARALGIGDQPGRLPSFGGLASPAQKRPLERTQVTHPPTNRTASTAYDVTRIPFTARTDSAGAGREGEPASCSTTGDTVWYRYEASATEGLIASTIGSGRPIALGIFTRSSDGYEQVECTTNLRGNAKTAFQATEATSYYFQVATPTGGGPIVFNLDPLGTIERVSISSEGDEANAPAFGSGISGDGRWVVFSSAADSLVDHDENGLDDVFVHDRETGETEIVSISSDGRQGNGFSGGSGEVITPDGRFVVFYSDASNLVDEDGDGDFDDDTNQSEDVFVHDRWTGETERVSLSPQGEQGYMPANVHLLGHTHRLSISADGRFVAFQSALDGLVPGDSEPRVGSQGDYGGVDVFVRDRLTGSTAMVSVHSNGTNGNDWSDHPSMSADGRYVAFRSYATNLVDGDDNLHADVFLHDSWSERTTRISMGYADDEADESSGWPVIAASGRYVAFVSRATNLVPDDTNDRDDVFLHELATGGMTRVSVTSDGAQQGGTQDDFERINLGSPGVAVSADGRFVAFESAASNLAPGSEESAPHADWRGVFVHDRLRGTTLEVSLPAGGESGRAGGVSDRHFSYDPMLSLDGRTVAFVSKDPRLVEGDTNGSSTPFTPTPLGDGPVEGLGPWGDDLFVFTFGAHL